MQLTSSYFLRTHELIILLSLRCILIIRLLLNPDTSNIFTLGHWALSTFCCWILTCPGMFYYYVFWFGLIAYCGQRRIIQAGGLGVDYTMLSDHMNDRDVLWLNKQGNFKRNSKITWGGYFGTNMCVVLAIWHIFCSPESTRYLSLGVTLSSLSPFLIID